mgnify:CR=1 FL=1
MTTVNLTFFNLLNFNYYGFRVCSNKRVVGFDDIKTEKYVANLIRSGQMSFSKRVQRSVDFAESIEKW